VDSSGTFHSLLNLGGGDFTIHGMSSFMASSALFFSCTMHAAARINRAGVRCWKAFLPIEIPAAPPAIAPSINSSIVRSSVF